MKRVNVITILSLTAVVLAIMTVPAMAATYEINKYRNWGVKLDNSITKWIGGTNYNTLDASDWIPDSPTADYAVEDNMDARWISDSEFKPPGYTGYHSGPKEPKLGATKYIPPSGYRYTANSREAYDLEALYFDSDTTYAYFAIVVSVDPSTSTGRMGDLALDLDGDLSKYDYCIILQTRSGFSQGDVVKVTSWSDPTDFPSSRPWRASAGTKGAIKAYVDVTDSGVSDYGRANRVIEIKVLRSALGDPSFSSMHTTMNCGNDVIELENVEWEIPEFTTIAIPVGMIIGLFYLFRRKRQSKGE